MAKPLVTIIIPTYNRAYTITRAINSVVNQSYAAVDILVIDDGSEDETVNIVNNISDSRIRLIRHPNNMGVTAAKNTGLNSIKGEWFTFLDSDDEMVPDAIEAMMNFPLFVDNGINAVSCNCLDSSTRQMSGKGLDRDQYLDEKTIIERCSGEFWGITKTELLGKHRFNNSLPGWEATLWFRINEKAIRYYVNKPLRIYYTEGNDRISKIAFDITKVSNISKALLEEDHYLDKLLEYKPKEYIKLCMRAIMALKASKEDSAAQDYLNKVRKTNIRFLIIITSFLLLSSSMINKFIYSLSEIFYRKLLKSAD